VSRSTSGPVLVLVGAGILLLLAGAAGIYAGLFLAGAIHRLLPAEITSDAAAIGGAALALGGALLLAGATHLVVAAVLRSGRGLVPGIALCAVMATLALGWAVAALVSGAAGSAPASAMLPAGIGLALIAGAYGWGAAVLQQARRSTRGRI
jgi:hypothetical protein